jgi:hypothetical protein
MQPADANSSQTTTDSSVLAGALRRVAQEFWAARRASSERSRHALDR